MKQAATRNTGPGAARARRTRAIIALAVVAVLAAVVIAAIPIYRDRVKPYNTTVLEVDGTSIKMRYFLKRAAISGESPVTTLQMLAQEQMIRLVAPKPPYSITVTAQDIDRYARELAQGADQTIGEAEFTEWYRQQLNESQLSETEYREVLRTNLLTRRMSAYLGERVPTVAEQVFVNMIPVKDSAVGAEVKERSDAGADFASLAREYSLDAGLKESGGKLGWFPRGVLLSRLEAAAFGLGIRQASDPISIDEQTTVVIMVSEKAAAREIDRQSLEVLKARALDVWLQKEYANHQIRFYGLHGGFDSETDAWVQRQIEAMRPKQPESGASP